MANADKPDMVMPGYIPSRKFVGTAASASTAAGYAAMLYEKKGIFHPMMPKAFSNYALSLWEKSNRLRKRIY